MDTSKSDKEISEWIKNGLGGKSKFMTDARIRHKHRLDRWSKDETVRAVMSTHNEADLVREYQAKWGAGPFYTVDIVVFNSTSNKVLMIRRGRWPGKGMLALPGGFIDHNENPQAAAARELAEETGVQVHTSKLVWVGFYSSPGRDIRGDIRTDAFVTMVDESVEIKAGDDAAEVQWVDYDERAFYYADHAKIISDARKIWERCRRSILK